ncbi:MAG: hypothetical protein KJO40_18315 [Deltaproteobacteria bacterium]|nr:hypothetical protein [Deltaproteobacteria bacterium]
MTKTLDNSSVNQAKDQVGDLKVVGDGDLFQLISKASSEKEGWMKSTKAMGITDEDGGAYGCVVQVTTQQGDHVAEAVCFVPGVEIREHEGARFLIASNSTAATLAGVVEAIDELEETISQIGR